MINRITQFSPCRQYRYTLWREWDKLFNTGYAMFIGLNPSTADEIQDDPTIRRCIGFAKSWGYGALCMTNLFAIRSTDPDIIKAFESSVGSDNDHWIIECAKEAEIVIAAWGNHGEYTGRNRQVLNMIKELHCLGTTKRGNPKHPLYLPKGINPIIYMRAEATDADNDD